MYVRESTLSILSVCCRPLDRDGDPRYTKGWKGKRASSVFRSKDGITIRSRRINRDFSFFFSSFVHLLRRMYSIFVLGRGYWCWVGCLNMRCRIVRSKMEMEIVSEWEYTVVVNRVVLFLCWGEMISVKYF